MNTPLNVAMPQPTRTPTLNKEASRIREMFSSIAPRYDLLNHLLSFNQDRRWRRILADSCELPPQARVLDICAGTGDLGVELANRRAEVEHVVAADFSLPMLELAREKIGHADMESRFALAGSDALRLPYRDTSFDLVICAFGVRNFEDTAAGLRELARVTKPGGQLRFLEFFRGQSPLMEIPFKLFFKAMLPMIGKIISKHNYAYSYLPNSVEGFCTRREMESLLKEAGYSCVEWRNLTFGVVTLFSAIREGDHR